MLDRSVFKKILKFWPKSEIDLFAPRNNAQLKRYASWKPDPEAVFIDAFSKSWSNTYFYAFPPFRLIGRCLQKVLQDEAECIIVVPN